MTTLLKRSGQRPLEINLADADDVGTFDGRHFGGREQNRWYEVQLYRLAEGWAAHVGYRTQWQGEVDVDWAEVGTAAEIAGWLESLQPMPPGVGFPPGDAYRERQERLLAGLQQQWGAAVSELLDSPEFAERAGVDSYDYLDGESLRVWARQQVASLGLTQAEACALCDANNGALWLEGSWLGIEANVFDADCLGQKWEIDQKRLGQRIAAADAAVKFALSWSIAQFWRRYDEDADRVLADLGFIRGGQS